MQASWPQKQWIYPQTVADLPFLGAYDLPPVANQLLQARGINNEDQLQAFINPKVSKLPDPNLLPDMDKAAKRLCQAILNKEQIVIFGDYDADGVTATALLYSFIAAGGCQTSWYIPHRTDEGYSLNKEAVKKIAETGCSLIITVDCGSNSCEEITLAKELGLDVIVTDHHPLTGQLPKAAAIVNPQRQDNRFPDNTLAGVGVAFHLAAATRRLLRNTGYWNNQRPEPDLRDYLDLVAIGSIADVVALNRVNRILVTAGLAQIMEGKRPGLNELIDISGVTMPLSAADISFKLAPRINAHGRLWRADEGVKLLLTADPRLAKALAVQLDTANNQRKAIEKEVVDECDKLLSENPAWLDKNIIVLADEHWHPGVVGIVAGRLVSQYGKPAIVIGRDGKGSGRSVETVDLADLLNQADDLLLGHGGHPAAAGLKIDLAKVNKLRERLAELTADKNYQLAMPKINIDALISLDDLDDKLLNFLQTFEPCGMGNQAPIFVTKDVPVKSIRPIGQEHIKLFIDHPLVKEAIGFKMANGAAYPLGSCKADLAYTVTYSTYHGKREMHLKLEDIIWKTGH